MDIYSALIVSAVKINSSSGIFPFGTETLEFDVFSVTLFPLTDTSTC